MTSLIPEFENASIAKTVNMDGSLIGAALFLNDDITLYYRIIDNGSNIIVYPFEEEVAEQLNIPTSIISDWYMQIRNN